MDPDVWEHVTSEMAKMGITEAEHRFVIGFLEEEPNGVVLRGKRDGVLVASFWQGPHEAIGGMTFIEVEKGF